MADLNYNFKYDWLSELYYNNLASKLEENRKLKLITVENYNFLIERFISNMITEHYIYHYIYIYIYIHTYIYTYISCSELETSQELYFSFSTHKLLLLQVSVDWNSDISNVMCPLEENLLRSTRRLASRFARLFMTKYCKLSREDCFSIFLVF